MESCGLYIHIPFCLRKCNYCDFISFEYKKELAEEFLLALFSELSLLSQEYDQTILETIYLGGGTPTCLSGEELARIIEGVKEHFPVKEGAEITCEMNPATGVEKDLKIMREAGINRISIGVQAFDDRILQYLGRVHNLSEALKTYYTVREVGFDNINLDLIFAIPGQTRKDWQDSLEIALKLNPEHLSLYNLKIEENTPFYYDYLNGKLKPVDEDTEYWMYQDAINTLKNAGFEHYEISNFARPGYASRHNLGYWHYKPYLGVGPGAHGFFGSLRYQNTDDLEEYISCLTRNKLPRQEELHLTCKDQMEEFVIMGLRVLEGVSLDEFRKRFGESLLEIYGTQIKKLIKLGLLNLKGNYLALTEKGLFLGNEVFAEFLL
ncbi:hypothetical protein BBF96_07130 [Anoxybacter fermentans]|uniref:Heme chaperone HemW n=1 Tax=Anoxybacter fermentans TaxID=1323375 RepID=A0A3Q9HQ41_9FIRM|nr:radical SAM family heme chaperone HemW [Anoxybacter fermentans]AZR73177.1 hypothetical protein BBF96_07130 [Anoxybacter fermentans]